MGACHNGRSMPYSLACFGSYKPYKFCGGDTVYMIATTVLSVLLAVAVIIAIIVIVKDRKKGKCCGSCSSCEGCPYNRENCKRKNHKAKTDLYKNEEGRDTHDLKEDNNESHGTSDGKEKYKD